MKTIPLIAASLLVISSVPGVSSAATINMIGSNTSNESWLTAGDWSNGAAASAGNDYIVGAGFQVRSPSSATTFLGDSLTVSGAGASLLLRTSSGGNVSTIGSLTVANGATIRNGISAGSVGANTQTLAGVLTFDGGAAGFTLVQTGGTAGSQASTTGPRNFVFNALVHGGGEVRLQDRGSITLNNAANDFSGTWVVGGGVNNTAGLITTLAHGVGAGTFLGGNASVTLGAYSYLALGYDWETTGALTMVANGGDATAVKMQFTNDITVGSLSIAGSVLADGTYDFAALSLAGFADYFDGTTGSITVGSLIPEPSSYALVAGVLSLGAMTVRRRRTSVALKQSSN